MVNIKNQIFVSIFTPNQKILKFIFEFCFNNFHEKYTKIV